MLRSKLRNDSGFTAVELAGVILIMGVIASSLVAMTFKREKDIGNNDVTSSVQNVVSSVQEGLKEYPEATYFAITDDTITGVPESTDKTFDGKVWGTDLNDNGKVAVWVGTSREDSTTYITDVQSNSINLAVISGVKPGLFQVAGANRLRGDYTRHNLYLYDSLTDSYNH